MDFMEIDLGDLEFEQISIGPLSRRWVGVVKKVDGGIISSARIRLHNI